MVRLSKWFLLAMMPGGWQLAAQTQPDLAGVLERLDRLEKENRDLVEQVRALRTQLEAVTEAKAGTAATAAPSPGSAATLEEKVEIQGQRIDEQAQTKVESTQKFPIRLTGMALFNTFLDSKQNGGVQYPVTAAPTGPSLGGATLRQTIIGLEYRGPATAWGGTVHGDVYMDFFSTTGNTNNIRMRTGSIEIDWKSRSVMVGVEKPIFNPREPSSLAQLGVSPLTGAGNLWLWLPQVRVEQDFSFTQSTGVRARAGVIATREAGPYAGSDITGPVEALRPGLEGRFEFFHNFDDEHRFEIAPGFHTSQTHAAGQSVSSQLFSLDWFVNPLRRVELTGAFYTGHNVAPLGEGYQQGFGFSNGLIDAVPSTGGWGQVTLHTIPRLDFHLFTGRQEDSDPDLPAGRIHRNFMFGGNLYFHLAPNVILALETTQLRTTYISQGTRINNHYDLALAYLF